LKRPCVNRGGSTSLVRLSEIPPLETEQILPLDAVEALAFWQARPGEIVTVADPERNFYRARLIELGPKRGVAIPFQKFSRATESQVAIEIYQALPEKERFELILQKLTEIGVTCIVPYTSRRSTTLMERDAVQKKSHRWPDVILRAAKQCRRGIIPELSPVLCWEEALERARLADLKLILFEGENSCFLKKVLKEEKPNRVALLIGPEGGFDPFEVEDARRIGFRSVSLGSRILRTETASIVSATLIQYVFGDLG
jgi:16S rRNA (uracil1498-N3)-methyltransferase